MLGSTSGHVPSAAGAAALRSRPPCPAQRLRGCGNAPPGVPARLVSHRCCASSTALAQRAARAPGGRGAAACAHSEAVGGGRSPRAGGPGDPRLRPGQEPPPPQATQPACPRRGRGCGRCRCSRFPLPEMASQGRAGPAAASAPSGRGPGRHRRGDPLRGHPRSPSRSPPRQPPLRVPAPRALTELVLSGRGHVAGWEGRGGGERRSAPPTPLRHRHRAGGRLSPPPSPPLPPPPSPPPAPCGSPRQWQRPLFCHSQFLFRESRRPRRPPPSHTRPGPAAAPPGGPRGGGLRGQH